EEARVGRVEITKATVLEVLAGDGDALGEEAAARGAAATAPAPGSGMAVGVPAFSANGDATGREVACGLAGGGGGGGGCGGAAASQAAVRCAGCGHRATACGGDAVQAQ